MNEAKHTIPVRIPTWGYHPAHGARLFELSAGAKLPPGWADVPHAGLHPHDVERRVEPASESEQAAIDAPARKIRNVASRTPACRRSARARKKT